MPAEINLNSSKFRSEKKIDAEPSCSSCPLISEVLRWMCVKCRQTVASSSGFKETVCPGLAEGLLVYEQPPLNSPTAQHTSHLAPLISSQVYSNTATISAVVQHSWKVSGGGAGNDGMVTHLLRATTVTRSTSKIQGDSARKKKQNSKIYKTLRTLS